MIFSVVVVEDYPYLVCPAVACDEQAEAVGGLLLLQLLHELGHYAAARLNQVELAFPSVLIPSLQIGLFGSVTRFLSFPKTRRQLFDVSIAGPVAGFVSSLACLLGGLYLTAGASPDALG